MTAVAAASPAVLLQSAVPAVLQQHSYSPAAALVTPEL